ncbi:MAG: transcription-repair coupling factor [Myxococcales bacterium]|nr:transcription-repair coupling factor [Myxococcales bacterium]
MREFFGSRRYPPLEELHKNHAQGVSRIAVAGLAGGSSALILATLLLETDGPALVLAADAKKAQILFDDLTFFLRAADGAASTRLFLYPAYDVAPFESISPHPGILARRMRCLAELAGRRKPIVVAPVEAVLNLTLSREDFLAGRQVVNVPDLFERDALVGDLLAIGYRMTPIVEEVGEVAVRGDIIDVFTPGGDLPLRIELFGDEVESIRHFDPSTQKSRGPLRHAELYSCSDVHLGTANAELFADRVKALAEAQDVPKPRRDRLVDEVTHRIAFPGIEFFTPLLHDKLEPLPAYLGGEGLVVWHEIADVEVALEATAEKIRTRFDRAREAGKLCVEPAALYLDEAGFRAALAPLRQVALGHEAYLENAEPIRFETVTHARLREQILARANEPHMLNPLVEGLRESLAGEGRAVLVSRTPGGADRLERLLSPYKPAVEMRPDQSFAGALSGGQGLTRVPALIGELSAGFSFPGLELTVFTEEDIFGERRRAETYAKRQVEMISSFSELAEGDFVVHLKHGVGIYRGLVHLTLGDVPGEFLHLEYAGGDRLYLPVDRLGAVQRYVGAGATPKIDRLGTFTWAATKKKARQAARKLAKELLALYAARNAQPGFAFPPPDEIFREFEATFPYDETPDQETAIRDVIADMVSERPADRLICGDVGFGKTEVAMRAAFLAVLGGKQVAVLCPTTTLAFQHFNTFRDRLAPFGVKIGMLSRFVQPAQQREAIKRLREGGIDLMIGTHMLLGKRIEFKNLGLLIVDEEQHFGVAQKEKIKSLARDIDVFTLTATPIPRTLHMSLTGIRDLSVINTPPEDRLAIRTIVTRWDEDTIREALERELSRGGQAFVIHNRVKSLDSVALKIKRLVPQARLGVGHGQMDEKALEKLMIDFSQGNFDIVVCTTIVESGLDFPRANTIIIDRADALGLSQLYQLRGRVGRSKRRAYCYLLVPPSGTMTPEARKRLAVLRTFTELGSGYKIAARDLEIRGAGNLLGSEQSGQIDAVGFDLYTRLLEEEIRRLRGEIVEERIDCEVAIRIPAYLPEEYVADVHLRLSLYKRIADARDDAELAQIREELADRFGRLPPAVVNLLAIVALRREAEKLRLRKIEAGDGYVAYEFDDSTPVTPSRLVRLVTANPDVLSLTPEGKLYQKTQTLTPPELLAVLARGLQRLADYAT